ncbi:hypothetical protein WJX72_010717 [[Myrmecia] bisecta]|uniref:Protein kinase domain-containing protein n=1 Tax=[Myrmecia] bisecta TaxID=41462 RepID=A0AAW1QSP1_9CHLO
MQNPVLTGQEAAVKVITNDRPKALEKLRNEVASLHRVKECGAVVRCQATFQDPENLYLVMELCHGSDLDNVFKTQGRLSELGTARVAYECLKVLATCHANHIIHGDVKPANFMLARSYSDPKAAIEGPPLQGAWLKAVDLGGSQVVSGDKRLTRRSGTPVYMAPEVFTREYGMEADLWSLGIMSYQLMTGRFPFWESIAACPETMEDVMAAVITQKVPFDVDELKRISPMGVDFLQQLLQTDPAQRISAAYALEHPWFREQFGCDSTPAEASNIVPIPPRCSLLTQQPRSRQRPTVQ